MIEICRLLLVAVAAVLLSSCAPTGRVSLIHEPDTIEGTRRRPASAIIGAWADERPPLGDDISFWDGAAHLLPLIPSSTSRTRVGVFAARPERVGTGIILYGWMGAAFSGEFRQVLATYVRANGLFESVSLSETPFAVQSSGWGVEVVPVVTRFDRVSTTYTYGLGLIGAPLVLLLGVPGSSVYYEWEVRLDVFAQPSRTSLTSLFLSGSTDKDYRAPFPVFAAWFYESSAQTDAELLFPGLQEAMEEAVTGLDRGLPEPGASVWKDEAAFASRLAGGTSMGRDAKLRRIQEVRALILNAEFIEPGAEELKAARERLDRLERSLLAGERKQ